MSNISLNITEDDVKSAESSSYSAIPAGSYNARVYEVKLEQVKSGPNEGKPRFNIQFRIEGGDYAKRVVFGYVALYKAGDFWKTQSFFKALGYDMSAGSFTVPDPQELAGKLIGLRVKVGKDQNGEDRNEVAGFDKPTAGGSVDAVLASIGATPVASSSDIWA